MVLHGEGGGEAGVKESSPGTLPVAALILSRRRLGWDNKIFTAVNWVSHSGQFWRSADTM